MRILDWETRPDWQPDITRDLELLTIGELGAVIALLITPAGFHIPVVGWHAVSVITLAVITVEIQSMMFGTLQFLNGEIRQERIGENRIKHAIATLALVTILNLVVY